MAFEYRTLPMSLKSLQDDGIFEGLAAFQGDVDRMGDRLLPGCMTKTIAQHGGKFFLLADHIPSLQTRVGISVLKDGPAGIAGRYQLNLNKAAGREMYEDLKFYQSQGLALGLSIGYQTKQSVVGKDGVREIKELELFECSVVSFPANLRAHVTPGSVKGEDLFAGVARELELWRTAVHATKQRKRPSVTPDAALIQGLQNLRQMKDFDESIWGPVVQELKRWQSQGRTKAPAKPTYTDGDEYWVYSRFGRTRRYPMVGR